MSTRRARPSGTMLPLVNLKGRRCVRLLRSTPTRPCSSVAERKRRTPTHPISQGSAGVLISATRLGDKTIHGHFCVLAHRAEVFAMLGSLGQEHPVGQVIQAVRINENFADLVPIGHCWG